MALVRCSIAASTRIVSAAVRMPGSRIATHSQAWRRLPSASSFIASALLHNGHLADVVLRVHPERFVHEAAENFTRQDGGALDRLHLRPHRMQAGHADPGVDLVRLVGNVI